MTVYVQWAGHSVELILLLALAMGKSRLVMICLNLCMFSRIDFNLGFFFFFSSCGSLFS